VTKRGSKPKTTTRAAKQVKSAGAGTKRKAKAAKGNKQPPPASIPAKASRTTKKASKVSARKPSKTAPALDEYGQRLQGKTLYLGGNADVIEFWDTQRMMNRSHAARLIRFAGGRVAKSITAKLDYFVPADGDTDLVLQIDQLNRSEGASIEILDLAAFGELLKPSRQAAIAMLSGEADTVKHWNQLAAVVESEGIDLSGLDFRKRDLSAVDLNHANIEGCDFRRANMGRLFRIELSGVQFDGAAGEISVSIEARDCSFRGCRVGINRARATNCVFDKADMANVRLPRADLSTNSFRGTNLTGAKLPKCDLAAADLTGAKLRNADLSEAHLVGANLSKADLRGANLTDADLKNATIDGANFKGAQLDGVVWTGVDTTLAKNLEACASPEGRVSAAATDPLSGETIPGSKPLDYIKQLAPLFRTRFMNTADEPSKDHVAFAFRASGGARQWKEVLATFEEAVAQATKKWGDPAERVQPTSENVQLWIDRTGHDFTQLAAWPRDDGNYVYIFAAYENRKEPTLVYAGAAG